MSQATMERLWRTHSNKVIKMSDMVDEHLLNSICMIDRGRTVRGDSLKPGQESMYDALVQEARNRNLEINESLGWDS